MHKKYIIFLIILVIMITACSGPSDSTTENNDWPDQSNTGLSDPGILSDSTGMTITTDGTTVSNLKIDGEFVIEANNVTVRNCRIYGGGLYSVSVRSGTGIVFEDCDIGMDSPSSKKGVYIGLNGYTEITLRRCYIHHLDDAVFIGGDTGHGTPNFLTMVDCYIAELIRNDPLDRPDGLEALNGNIFLTHNRFGDADYMNSNLQLQCSHGDFGDITLDNNWFNGGGYSIKIRDPDFYIYDFNGTISIINNHFGRGYDHGLLDKEAHIVLTDNYGNVWHDTGEPVSDVDPNLK